jgi:hypothetical protein
LFVYVKQWTKDEVKAYFTMLCINNKASIDLFMLYCCNYLLVQNLATMPYEYDNNMVAYVEEDCAYHSKLYNLPAPPSLWSIGSVSQWVETITHLAMNAQKAVLKVVLHRLAADLVDHGPALKIRLQPLIELVQELQLPYIPCRMLRNNKFGGFVAKTYHALTMLLPWLFQCLLDDEFAPRQTIPAPLAKPRSK